MIQRSSTRSAKPQVDEVLEAVRDALTRLRFGSISLTVHDSELVQLEVTEKRRFGH